MTPGETVEGADWRIGDEIWRARIRDGAVEVQGALVAKTNGLWMLVDTCVLGRRAFYPGKDTLFRTRAEALTDLASSLERKASRLESQAASINTRILALRGCAARAVAMCNPRVEEATDASR